MRAALACCLLSVTCACTVELPEAPPPADLPRVEARAVDPDLLVPGPDEPPCLEGDPVEGVVEGCVGACAWMRSTVPGAELVGDPYRDYSLQTEYDEAGRPVSTRLVAVLADGVVDARNGEERPGGFVVLPTDPGAMYCAGVVRLRVQEAGWDFELSALRRLPRRSP